MTVCSEGLLFTCTESVNQNSLINHQFKFQQLRSIIYSVFNSFMIMYTEVITRENYLVSIVTELYSIIDDSNQLITKVNY